MNALPAPLRRLLENAAQDARDVAEAGALAALNALAVSTAEPFAHLSESGKALRRALRAQARQLGDAIPKGAAAPSIAHLVEKVAYDTWHRFLFTRFLAENQLLQHPGGASVTLQDCEELIREDLMQPQREFTAPDGRTLAVEFAARMLPAIFRADDPAGKVALPPEHRSALFKLIDDLPRDVFIADDSLGWCYQFWQARRKEAVNRSGRKIGANELPAVTQLFTEHYMVLFLLHNTIGAWWAAKQFANSDLRFLIERAETEDECRKLVSVPGVNWEYLRFIRAESETNPRGSPDEARDHEESGKSEIRSHKSEISWRPAAGSFPGWPKTLREFRLLDPCCGSGHFLVAAFILLVWLRMQDEGLSAREACDAVLRDNLHGLELDPRCTQIAAFNLALAAWKFPDLPAPVGDDVRSLTSSGSNPEGQRLVTSSPTRAIGFRPLPALHIACSGLGVNARKEDWLALANGNDRLRQGMERLYDLFQKAPELGSLIDPRALGHGDLLTAGFAELEPLLGKALQSEKAQTNDELNEMGVAAQGMARAAEILAGQFHLVVTNVPYLGSANQCDRLQSFSNSYAKDARADLATVFLQRCLDFCTTAGTAAVVTPQNWLFLTSYRAFRVRLLKSVRWECLARLGPGAFDTIGGEVVKASLIALTKKHADECHKFWGIDAGSLPSVADKANCLMSGAIQIIGQAVQLNNPDARVTLEEIEQGCLLRQYADAFWGQGTGDFARFGRNFWEIAMVDSDWDLMQSTVIAGVIFGGREFIVFWQQGNGELVRLAEELRARLKNIHRRGSEAWGRDGVAISLMSNLLATVYTGQIFDGNCAAIVPKKPEYLGAIWTFCSSPEFNSAVRRIDQKLNVTNHTLLKVPFDLAHWQSVAAAKYPHGLPKPHSDDPTQWLFNGHPNGAENPLQVAVARLLGYRWPRQTGSSFPDCPALEPDGLEPLADADGVVCIPPVGQEQPAENRLRAFLLEVFRTSIPTGLRPPTQGCEARATLGNPCSESTTPTGLRPAGQDHGPNDVPGHNPVGVEDSHTTDSQGSSFLATLGFGPESLWDSPGGVPQSGDGVPSFVAAGFTAWVDSLLADAGFAGKSLEDWLRNGFFEQHCKLFHQRPFIWHLWDGRKDGFGALVNYHKLDRALLDKLIYTYLGDWITRQEAGVQSGEGGSDARLTAARDLQRRLKLIAEGEPPHDIFVRWKALACQPIGWEPDLNDGVRLNIRPFVTAGVLRKNPTVNWNKDRGKDPASAPWFAVFHGDRINDHHLTVAEKRAARASQNQAS